MAHERPGSHGRATALVNGLFRLRLFVILALACFVAIGFLAQSTPSGVKAFKARPWRNSKVGRPMTSDNHLRSIAIATNDDGNYEAYYALAWTLQNVLSAEDGSRIQIYAHPMSQNYSTIISEGGLFHGTYKTPRQLIPDLEYRKFETNVIDTLIFGACETDLGTWGEDLVQVWDSRPETHKFRVICLVHDAQDTIWFEDMIPWAKRGVLQLVATADHVAKTFRTGLGVLADEPNLAWSSALWEYVKIDVHYPITTIPLHSTKLSRGKVLSNVAIIGYLDDKRQDYRHTLKDLQRSLADNPAAWGYVAPRTPVGLYEPDARGKHAPFKLHLIGDGELDVAPSMRKVIEKHPALSYPEFYQVLQSMDMVILAWAERGGYYDLRVSPTIQAALQCDVPIMVTRRIREVYSQIDDDQVVVTRPQGLREIEAIKALRTGVASTKIDTRETPKLLHDVETMIRGGWRRPRSGFKDVKERLWRHNEALVEKMMTD